MSPALLLAAMVLGACKGDGDNGDDTALDVDGDIALVDANNYSYTGLITVPPVVVNEATDARVDWSELSMDMRGRPLDPTAVDDLLLVGFVKPQEEVLAEIVQGIPPMSIVGDYRLFTNSEGATEAMLSDFAVLGNAFNPEDELVSDGSIESWAVIVQQETEVRTEALMLAFLELVPSGGSDTIMIENESADLDFDVTLGQNALTSEGLSYTLDWSGVSLDGVGEPFDPLRANNLFVGHIDVETDEEIVAGFLTLLEDADAYYTQDVYGETSADLSLCLDAAGQPFPGFSAGGSWIVGVECTSSSCLSPAPMLFTRVEVR